jgi:hypothetical protein
MRLRVAKFFEEGDNSVMKEASVLFGLLMFSVLGLLMIDPITNEIDAGRTANEAALASFAGFDQLMTLTPILMVFGVLIVLVLFATAWVIAFRNR